MCFLIIALSSVLLFILAINYKVMLSFLYLCIISFSFHHSQSAEVVSFVFLLLLSFLRYFTILLFLTWDYNFQEGKEIVNNFELNDKCKKWIKIFSFKDLFIVKEWQLLHMVSYENLKKIFWTEQKQTSHGQAVA